MKVSLNPNYRMPIYTITLYNMSKYTYGPRVTSAPRRRSRGSAWLYHVALRATSHPRGSRAKLNPLFILFLNFLNDLNSKINS